MVHLNDLYYLQTLTKNRNRKVASFKTIQDTTKKKDSETQMYFRLLLEK